LSGTILTVIVIAVLWLVVLVPMFSQRRREQDASQSAERFSSAMRVLARRKTPALAEGDLDYAADSDDPAMIDRPMPSARAEMLARRRRTLSTVTMLAAVALVLAIGWRPVAWIPQIACDVLLSGYLWWLRAEAKRERVRRRRRRQRSARGERVARPASRARVVRIDEWDEPDAQDIAEASGAGQGRSRVVSLAEARRRERAVYGVVALDDDDPDLVGDFEEDEYPTAELFPPRAVNI